MAAAKKPAAKKMAAPKPPTPKKPPSEIQFGADTDKSKKAYKAGMDARGRASKYGIVSGPTYVMSSKPSYTTTKVEASTKVKSARGNYYNVFEDKIVKDKFRDKNRKTTFEPVNPPKPTPEQKARAAKIAAALKVTPPKKKK